MGWRFATTVLRASSVTSIAISFAFPVTGCWLSETKHLPFKKWSWVLKLDLPTPKTFSKIDKALENSGVAFLVRPIV
ncbi:MAG: hypothetical protein KDE57_16820 [Calditrichaeota bacterium]|nr:hypothetical protein [Calditrichota bacterium]